MTPTLAKKRKAPKRRTGRNVAPGLASWKLCRAGRVQLLEAPPLERLEWLVHGFSTRPGGTRDLAKTRGNRRTANRAHDLGFTAGDSPAHMAENRQRFFRAVGADAMRAVTLRQIHSDIVHRVDSPDRAAGDPLGGDALVTRAPGCLLVIKTADCVPILLADSKQRAIAAIHAGWRGTVHRIAAKTLGRMQMEFGTRPQDVVAALGPSIGRCCYEVGEDVAREFHAQFPEARQWFDGPFDALASGENDPNWLPWLTMMPPGHQPPPLRVHLDLIAANRAILAAAGVPSAQISSSGFCTACRTDLFFSYRREGTTGRLLAAIGIR